MPPNGSVQGVGKGIAEYLCQVWVSHASKDVVYDLFNRGRGEGAAVFEGSLER